MSENPGGDVPENAGGDVPENVRAASGWQAVVEDMAATADAYRDRGWRTLELHPGDSVLVDSEFRTGLDVVVPGPEYEALESATSDAEFSYVEVYRAEGDGMFYLLVVEKAPASETAVFVPAYYDPASAQEKLETIRDDGELRLFCRRLNDDYVEFVHDDVAPFLPEALADDE